MREEELKQISTVKAGAFSQGLPFASYGFTVGQLPIEIGFSHPTLKQEIICGVPMMKVGSPDLKQQMADQICKCRVCAI